MNSATAFLKNFINAIVLHAVICIIDFYTIDVKYSCLYFIVSLLVSFFGNAAAKKPESNFLSFVLCFLLSAAVFFGGFFAKAPFAFYIFSVIVFFWMMFLRYGKTTSGTDFAHRSFILLFIFMFITGQAFKTELLCKLSVLEGFVFFIINIFLSGVFVHEKFIVENKDVKNMPYEQIRKTYTPLLISFCAVCLAAMLFWQFASPPVNIVSDYASKILYQIGRHLPKPEIKPGEIIDDTPKNQDQYSRAVSDFGITKKTNQTLENVGTVVSIILLTVCILTIIFLLLRHFIKTMHLSKKMGSDEIEFVFSEDKISKAPHVNIKDKLFESGDINKKIRRLYRKYVLKNVKNVSASDTPLIIENKTNSTKAIREIYEKARYSGLSCTKYELEQMKNDIKNL